MRRLLGFAIIAGFSFSSFAAAQVADPQSTKQSTDNPSKQDKDQEKNQKKDPEQIRNRKLPEREKFYSLAKEIALGKQLARQVAEGERK
jgi:hypothetical protein